MDGNIQCTIGYLSYKLTSIHMTRLSFGIERGIYRERQTRQQMKKWSSTNTSTMAPPNICIISRNQCLSQILLEAVLHASGRMVLGIILVYRFVQSVLTRITVMRCYMIKFVGILLQNDDIHQILILHFHLQIQKV